MEKRLVRVIANDKRYVRSMYKAVPVFREDWNTFLTGQHVNPYDPSTSGNLTLQQMRGLEPLTNEQRRKFGGHVINPDVQLNIKHNRLYDVTIENGVPVNPVDYWELNALNYQVVVAKTKDEYNPQIHRFYLEDKEHEATISISKRETTYKAVELVRRNLSLEKLINVAVLLNYYSKNFKVDTFKISKTLLLDLIYTECEQNPEAVLKCFEESAEQNLHILQLVEKGILRKVGTDFFEGSTYLGDSLDAVNKYMSKEENRATVNKWSALSRGDIVITEFKNNDMALQYLNEGLHALLSNDKSKLSYAKIKLNEIKAIGELEKLLDAEKKVTASSDTGTSISLKPTIDSDISNKPYNKLTGPEREEYKKLKQQE